MRIGDRGLGLVVVAAAIVAELVALAVRVAGEILRIGFNAGCGTDLRLGGCRGAVADDIGRVLGRPRARGPS